MSGGHELLGSKTVYQGKLLRVEVDEVRLPDGASAIREVVRHPGAVGIAAIVDGDFLMVRQMRHPVGEELLQLPAGKLDRPGESPQECARRELEEETGYTSKNLRLLSSFYTTPGYSDEIFHMFLAINPERLGDPPSTDDGEPIHLERLPISWAAKSIAEGKIVDAKSIVGILLTLSHTG